MSARLPCTIVGTVAALTAAGSACAQAPVGSFDGNVRLATRYDATAAMADCLLKRDDGKAGNLVTVPGGDWDKAYRAISVTLENCMKTDGTLTMSSSELRGIVAERLLIEHDGRVLTQAKTAASSPATRIVTVKGEHLQDPVFDCVARSEPAKAAALFDHAVASTGEAAAFRALIPTMQSCMPLTAEFKIKPGEVRPRMAIALYRRLAASNVGAMR